MNLDPKLLTIAEFSKLSGKSRQAIYKQVDKKLSPYVSTVNNQIMIDFRALEEVYGIKRSNPSSKQETTDKLIEILQKELEIKNAQIERLQTQLEQSQKLIDQAQQLQAVTEQKIKLLEQKTELAPDKKSWWKFWE